MLFDDLLCQVRSSLLLDMHAFVRAAWREVREGQGIVCFRSLHFPLELVVIDFLAAEDRKLEYGGGLDRLHTFRVIISHGG